MKYVVLVLIMLVWIMPTYAKKYHVQCVDAVQKYTVTYKSSIVKDVVQGDYGTIIFLKDNVIIRYKPYVYCKIIKK